MNCFCSNPQLALFCIDVLPKLFFQCTLELTFSDILACFQTEFNIIKQIAINNGYDLYLIHQLIDKKLKFRLNYPTLLPLPVKLEYKALYQI